MPLPPMQTPPALVSPAPDHKDAVSALLEAFDWGRPLPPAPKLKGMAALEYRWLLACATFDPAREGPANPFVAGRARTEAEALRRLLQAPKDQVGAALQTLSAREPGTALALWRWGQAQVRTGGFDAHTRTLWEDQLLRTGPELVRGYALRHALCWALAEQDEARFVSLRYAAGEGFAETVAEFQRLFGLLGGPSPVLRLWVLPGLDYRDLRLDQLGASHIWICPLEDGPLPELPTGTCWIIPSATGALDERDASLPESLQSEIKTLAQKLESRRQSTFFAPSRAAFEHLGLVWFPSLIELDPKGAIRSIRMGDAAPRQP